jgi:Resolvase, N terminal domain
MTPARRGGKRVGYIRVSSVDQNELRQLDGVQVDKRFTDKASGKDTKRPQLQAALDYLRDGDVLVVHSMDRLARNLDDLRKMVTDPAAASPSRTLTRGCGAGRGSRWVSWLRSGWGGQTGVQPDGC